MRKYDVLIVDDDPDFCESMSLALRRLEVEVRIASNSADASFMLRSQVFDCLLCDYQLGKEDGIELIPTFRSIAPQVPVIIVTGFGAVSAAVKALKSGAANFLEKPVSPEALFRAVMAAAESKHENLKLRAMIEKARLALHDLSKREREIARDLVTGLTSRQIALKYDSSPRTIETHRSNILAKLNLKNTPALVRLVVLSELPASYAGASGEAVDPAIA